MGSCCVSIRLFSISISVRYLVDYLAGLNCQLLTHNPSYQFIITIWYLILTIFVLLLMIGIWISVRGLFKSASRRMRRTRYDRDSADKSAGKLLKAASKRNVSHWLDSVRSSPENYYRSNQNSRKLSQKVIRPAAVPSPTHRPAARSSVEKIPPSPTRDINLPSGNHKQLIPKSDAPEMLFYKTMNNICNHMPEKWKQKWNCISWCV